MLCAKISTMAWNGATQTKACDSRTIQHEMQDEHIHLPHVFGGCILLLFAMGGLRLWLKKHAVFREIHDGMGWVQQELSMEMNRNITKNWLTSQHNN